MVKSTSKASVTKKKTNYKISKNNSPKHPVHQNDLKLTILTPVYNTPSAVLKSTINSVLNQTVDSWELFLINDASTDQDTLKTLSKYRGVDARIKIIDNSTNQHISASTNIALTYSTGSYLGFLDHDDLLTPDAVEEVLKVIQHNPKIDIIYSDEDKIDASNQFIDPYFKPDWSPEHLTSVMYMLHFFIIRRSLFNQLGGLRSEYDGAQDYDLALRATKLSSKVHHIPKILYHWRIIKGSAAEKVDAKPYALEAGLRALKDWLGDKGEATKGLLPGFFRVRYHIPKEREVTLVILTADTARKLPGRKEPVNLVRQALESIYSTTEFKNFKTLVVHNNDLSNATLKLINHLGVEAVSYNLNEPQFNYSKTLNFALKHVKTEHVISLNDDIEIVSPDWIEGLIEWLEDPEIGIVGGKLLYPNLTLQHASISLIPESGATHPFYRMKADEIGYNGFTHLVKNVSAVTGALLATKMSIVNQVGGFNPLLSTDFNDVDFCLKVIQAGYRIVWTPFVELIHYESSSLVRTSQNSYEVALFNGYWGNCTNQDPYLDLPKIKQVFPHAIDPNNTAPC